MRILMTTDTVGGVWTFTSELTQQLLQRGHSVHLVSFGRRPTADQQAWTAQWESRLSPRNCHPERSEGPAFCPGTAITASPQRALTYTPTEIPLEWMQNNDRVFEAGQQLLLSELHQHPADLIVSNQFCFGRLATPVPRIVIAHSDVLSWARACKPSALEPTPWLKHYTSMIQGGLLDASAVVTPTAWMGKTLTANFFLPRNYYVIPNGVSVEPAQHPAPNRKFQAITAGRLWDEAKGLDTLRDLNVSLPLLVAGENVFESPDPDTSWPRNLKSLGPLSPRALHTQFRESAIYLCTSRYEPFGLAPLEAALCGCALVARDIPSLREVWADNALYFTDNTSLTNTLTTLANDPQLLAHAQTRSHQRALHFAPERMTDSYLHLFESVLKHPHPMPHVA